MTNLESQLAQAQTLSQQGKEDEARMLLLELLQKEPNHETALLMLGGSYFCSNKLSEAEMAFERLVLLAPGCGKYSIALFNTLWKLERQEEALEEIKRFMGNADKQAENETIQQYLEIIKQIGNPG